MTNHTLVAPEWISQEAMQTLSSGYLLPGETPRAMFERVASAASRLNEDESLYEDVFECLWNGWLGLSSPVAANFGTTRSLPISCLETGTRIHTKDGFKEVQNLQPGDLVLTHLGNWKPVLNVWSRQTNGDLYSLSLNGLEKDSLNITGNHPVLTNKGWVKVEDLDNEKHQICTEPIANEDYQNHFPKGTRSFKVNRQNRETTVWDIEVADDHSFIAQGVVVHNCYSIEISDSTPSIFSHLKEVAMLSKNGGGVGVYFGNIRPSGAPISDGGVSLGKTAWMEGYDWASNKVGQGGNLRKGSFALYSKIDDPDYPEILRTKDHTKGDPRSWIDSNLGVVITDEFMDDMIENGGHKQWLFGETIRTRLMTGSPYMLFIDNVNRQNPDCYKERGLDVKFSNLCSEITLYTDENHSFVCVLSSLNLSKWFEWKDWRSPRTGRSVPEVAIHLLEAVVTEFIKKAEGKTGMGRAVRFAKKSRALGLGTMGLHSLYQSQNLPFKSEGARALNIETHKFIREQAEKASRELAERFGEPEWCVGSGRRHTHLTAIAPTKTNSVISGAFSEGISPMDYNYYVAKQDKGAFVRKNPHLEKIFCERNVSPEVWSEINKAQGSVQGLDCLTDHEKDVFKTAREIDQFELIKQASDRQPDVCQAQSLNLWVDPYAEEEYLLKLHIYAHKAGVKSLYYLKSKSALIANQDEMDADCEEPAIVVTKKDCPYCSMLKNKLIEDSVDFIEIDKEQAVESGMWSDNWRTVPQLYLNNRWIGGYTEYMAMDKSMVSHNTKVEEVDNSGPDCSACES